MIRCNHSEIEPSKGSLSTKGASSKVKVHEQKPRVRQEMIKCNHSECQEHEIEPSKGSLSTPPGYVTWTYGVNNPLMVSSRSGANECLSYAIASLRFPPHPVRPEEMVAHFYSGTSFACPILDSKLALFELHKDGPFLEHRRAMLRESIVSSQSFAGRHYEKSLVEGFESLNACLSNANEKPPSKDCRLWGCGAFSMAVIVKGKTLYTAGAAGLCVVLRQDKTMVFPSEWDSIWCSIVHLEMCGKLRNGGERHFKSAVLASHKVELQSGDHVLVLPQNLYRLGQVAKLCRAGLEKGFGLREICLDVLDESGMMAIGVTAPLALFRIV